MIFTPRVKADEHYITAAKAQCNFCEKRKIVKCIADRPLPIEYPSLLTFHCCIIYNYHIKYYTLLIFFGTVYYEGTLYCKGAEYEFRKQWKNAVE